MALKRPAVALLLSLASVAPGMASAAAPAPIRGDDGLDPRIADALRKAKSNRREIEAFLARYERCADREKRDASRWLVANMDGHGYEVIELVDGAEGGAAGTRTLGFNALDHEDLAHAKDALAAKIGRAHV